MGQRGALARFQDDFVRVLLDEDAAAEDEMAALAAQPAFAVYRNTVLKGCIDALQANYPALVHLVGEEWFRAAAAVHARETPPRDPALLFYGENFADFLAQFEPAAALPYLPAVAHIDRLWTEAHAAADEQVMTAAAIAAHTPAGLGKTVLTPHAAARWAWFPDAPACTIWARSRLGVPCDPALAWRSEGVLLTRPQDAVRWIAVDAAVCAFLDACAGGATIGAAATAALQVEADVDFAALMQCLLAAGAFRSDSERDDAQPSSGRPR